MKRNFIINSCLIIALFLSAQIAAAQARNDYELAYGYSSRDSGYRSAVDMDDWLERGHASVTESPLFPEGIRLTASASEKGGQYEPGLASVIYYFTVPRWAQYLKISIRYKDAAQDDKIAGRLWIKSTDDSIRGRTEPGEAVPFYGDTFILRSERLSETITLSANRRVENGTVEMHIVVDGRDCLDVRDIQVEYLDTQPQVVIVNRPSDDYWDQLPRYRYSYHYYYWGPLFWPKASSAFECWDVPQRFYWVTWRPWFRVFVKGFSKHSWWEQRRYTAIYHDDVKRPPIERRSLLQQRLRERHGRATPATPATPMTRQTTRRPVQNHPSQNQEIRLKKEIGSNRSPATAVNRKPTQIQQKGQPIQADRQREKTMAPTKTERHQAVNEAAPRPSPSAPTASQRTQKDQLPPQTAGPQPQSGPAVREAIQTPPRVQTPQGNKTIQEQKARGPAAISQVATPQPRQEIKLPRSHNEVQRPQPQPVGPQPQSRPVIKEAAQTPTGTHTPQSSGTRQEQMSQRPATTGQQGMPQPRQETQQPRSYNAIQKPQPQAAGPQPRSGPVVREAAQAPHVDRIKQGQKTQSPAVIGQVTAPRPGQEKQQPNDHATGKNDQK